MSTANALNTIARQVHIYFGVPILALGVIGESLNLIVFSTLKTFRETTCAFYLTVVSAVNLGQLVTVLLIRVLTEGFHTDLRRRPWICKAHIYIAVWCLLMSLTGMCFATIDQYISMTRFRHLSNMRAAQRNVLIACVVWGVYCIPFPVFRDAPGGVCKTTDGNFMTYSSYFHFPVLRGLLPISIMVTFSVLAYCKARSLLSQQMNIVYLSRDRQLTAMTLVHVVYVVTTTLPYVTFFVYSLNQTTADLERTAYVNLIYVITLFIEYTSFCSSFYIYCCVSDRFRRQFIYVLTKLCVNRCQRWTGICLATRVTPSTDGTTEEHLPRKGTLDDVSVRYIAK